MTDRELLELAAKAAGYAGLGVWDDAWGCLTDHEGWTFDPLRDDGDALRLSVRLGIDVMQRRTEPAEVWAQASMQRTIIQPFGDDPYAATRRAITRAAAEIGRAMG